MVLSRRLIRPTSRIAGEKILGFQDVHDLVGDVRPFRRVERGMADGQEFGDAGPGLVPFGDPGEEDVGGVTNFDNNGLQIHVGRKRMERVFSRAAGGCRQSAYSFKTSASLVASPPPPWA